MNNVTNDTASTISGAPADTNSPARVNSATLASATRAASSALPTDTASTPPPLANIAAISRPATRQVAAMARGAQSGTRTTSSWRMFSTIALWILTPGKRGSTAVLCRSLRPTAVVPRTTILPRSRAGSKLPSRTSMADSPA